MTATFQNVSVIFAIFQQLVLELKGAIRVFLVTFQNCLATAVFIVFKPKSTFEISGSFPLKSIFSGLFMKCGKNPLRTSLSRPKIAGSFNKGLLMKFKESINVIVNWFRFTFI